jgi:hypothetical protein
MTPIQLLLHDHAVLPVMHVDVPLWCIYGPKSFPTTICCMIKRGGADQRSTLILWGYSIYRNTPGFRTLGVELGRWSSDNDPTFFTDQDKAMEYLRLLTKPQL